MGDSPRPLILSLPGLTRQSITPPIKGVTIDEKTYWFYILAGRRNGTLYCGVTNNLSRRVWEHKEGIADGFTKEYGVKLLVYYESYRYVHDAIQREKNIKKWPRRWKIDLVRSMNPEWRDLYEELAG